MTKWPISLTDVEDALRRIRPHLPPTPMRHYPQLEQRLGRGIQVFVKHENHNPTNSFKVRNAVSVLTSLTPEERSAGVVAATRGNHGQAVAWAGQRLGVPVTLCVPARNNPEKNEGMRGLGARLIEQGADYDEAIAVADELSAQDGLRLVHATNDLQILAGAATIALEMVEQEPELDAIVTSIGGGSQAVGALTVARAMRPELDVFGVQSAAAPTMHDSWHAGRPSLRPVEKSIAEGLDTRDVYELTFGTLCEGLVDFLTVTEAEIAEAIRVLLVATHNLAEGSGATGLAGLFKLADRLAGKRIGIIISGANIGQETLRRVMRGEI